MTLQAEVQVTSLELAFGDQAIVTAIGQLLKSEFTYYLQLQKSGLIPAPPM